MESATLVGKYTCDIPVYFGAVKYLSHGIAITSTIMWYYLWSALWTNGLHPSNPVGFAFQPNSYAAAIGTAMGSIFLVQLTALYVQQTYGKCNVGWFGSLISFGIGFLIGTALFYLVWGTGSDLLPYADITEPFTTLSLGGVFGRPREASIVKSDAKNDAPVVQQSSKMDDSDEFVCDLYKNGQLITTTVSE
jgi:hypothetical protein